MKKYLIIDEVGADIWTEEHETKEKAIAAANKEWDALTEHDKNRRISFYILETEDPNSLDGDIIKEYK